MATQVKTITVDMYTEGKTSGNRAYVGERRLYMNGSNDPNNSITIDALYGFSSAKSIVGYSVASMVKTPWLSPWGSGVYDFTTTPDPWDVLAVNNVLGWNMRQYADEGMNIVFRLKNTGDAVKREIRFVTSHSADYPLEQEAAASIEFWRDDVLLTGGTFNAGSRCVVFPSYGDYPISVIHTAAGIPWLFDFNGELFVSNASISASYYRKNNKSAAYSDFNTQRITINLDGTQVDETNPLARFLEKANHPGEYITGDDLDEDNPFAPGGTSGTDKPDPNFIDDDDDDNIIGDDPVTDDLPDETTMGASATGFATLFSPSKTQLKNLAGLMWNATFLQAVRNLIENIKDLFVSLAMVPFNIPKGSTVDVTWFGISSGVSLTLASKQFLEFDMGTISLGGVGNQAFSFDTALDYSPFSHLGIYLPFIGYRDLDIDECRKAVIGLKYRIDILSGESVAIINVGGRDLYQFTGNCLSQIPISNENMQSLVTDAVQVGLAVMGMQAASGVAAAEDAVAGNIGGEMGELRSAHASAHLTHSRGALASATANAMLGMKPHITKTGSVSGASAMMAVRQPYLVLRTPRQAVPENYEKYCGFPSNVTGTLGSFSGYTVVEDIRLNGLVATSPEVAEIYKLLKQGVIV